MFLFDFVPPKKYALRECWFYKNYILSAVIFRIYCFEKSERIISRTDWLEHFKPNVAFQ